VPGVLRANVNDAWVDIATSGPAGARGATGVAGAPGATGPVGVGVPVGGVAGDVLTKVDDTDYNTRWAPGALIANGAPLGATAPPSTAVQVCTWVLPDSLIGRSAMFVWQAIGVITAGKIRVELKFFNPATNVVMTSIEKIDNVGGGNTIRTMFFVGVIEPSAAATPYQLTLAPLDGSDANGLSVYSDPSNHQGYALVF
jgi:hypothetical protein